MAMPCSQNSPYLPASTPRSADVVLYLDLDGVVHHEKVLWHPTRGIYMSPYEAAGHTLFEWIPILESVLEPYPAVALVLPPRIQRNPQTASGLPACSVHWRDVPQACPWRGPLEPVHVSHHTPG